MNINDASTTSAISHVPAFRMNLTEFQGIFGVMRRMRNISLLCWPHYISKQNLKCIEFCCLPIKTMFRPRPSLEAKNVEPLCPKFEIPAIEQTFPVGRLETGDIFLAEFEVKNSKRVCVSPQHVETMTLDVIGTRARAVHTP